MSSAPTRHVGLNARDSQSSDREAEPVMFGFWVFLMSDLVLFALLLATYATMTTQGLAGGPGPREIADLTSAAVETMLLLASSVTFGMVSLEMKYRDDTGPLLVWLGITASLGLAFLAMEATDFAALAAKGAVPQRSGFLSAHYTVLGMHFVHVVAGLAWMAVLVAQLTIRGLDDPVRLRLMRLALFWHMLDIVWVALFSFVYLAAAA